MTPEQIQADVVSILLVLSIILLGGAFSGWLSRYTKMPDTVMFIVAGVVLGPLAFGVVNITESSEANLLILLFGAAYILYDGGREIEVDVLKKIKISLISLATIGVLITTAITAFFSHFIFTIDWPYAILLGAVLAPTDPSVLVPLFKVVKVSPRLKQLIIAESALNDATGAVLATTAKGVIAGGAFSFLAVGESLGYEAGVGLAIGLLVGLIYAFLIGHEKTGMLKDYPTQISLTAVLFAYSVTTSFGASGFMAVFMVGMVCGNMHTMKLSGLASRIESQTRFREELTLIVRMMIFVLLGAHIRFETLFEYKYELILLVLIQIFVARPVSSFLATFWDRTAKWKLKELAFLAWTRETGVIPAALAGSMVAAKVPHADIVSASVFAMIFVSLVIQAGTAGYVAKLLKLNDD